MPRDDRWVAAHTISAGAPYDTAKLFRSVSHMVGDHQTLFYHRNEFYSWSGRAYPEVDPADLRASLYGFLDQCASLDDKGNPHRFKPNKSRVANVVDGLQAAANLSSTIAAPVWLDQVPDLDPADMIACQNGLLHLPTLALLLHTPLFFAHNALDFAYDAAAPVPAQWFDFLSQLWPSDPESIDTLQEIFGLCLTPETRHQKAFLLVGPKRAGKGVIARILIALLGRSNTISPTLASLGERFGLAPLIGKLLAVISDARLGAKADQHAIAESILRITGEDDVEVDRKYREAWNGRMRARFLVISNELPRLADTSGALASRFIVLKLSETFFDREDQTLSDRLLTELPGILNWSIAGLQRLRTRGHFVQPATAAEAVQTLEDLASPIGAFVRDCCTIHTAHRIGTERLFEAWRQWCESQGRDHPGTAQTFGRDLTAVCPSVTTTNPLRSPDGRTRYYQGISLR